MRFEIIPPEDFWKMLRAFQKMDFDLSDSETVLVASISKHSGLMLNMFSTMVIEASTFQLPSMNLCLWDKCKAIEKCNK